MGTAGDLTSHGSALQLRDSAGLAPASHFSPTIRDTGTAPRVYAVVSKPCDYSMGRGAVQQNRSES